MPHGRAAQVEAVGVLPVALVAVRGRDEHADPGSGRQLHPAELGVLVHDAREHPDRRRPAQALLGRLGEVLGILARERLLLGIGEQRVQRGRDDVARLVQAAGDEQLDVRADLVLAVGAGVDERAKDGPLLGAVPVGGDGLVDEPVGALAALPGVGVVGVVADAVDERLGRELEVGVARGVQAEQHLQRPRGERAGEVAHDVHVPALAQRRQQVVRLALEHVAPTRREAAEAQRRLRGRAQPRVLLAVDAQHRPAHRPRHERRVLARGDARVVVERDDVLPARHDVAPGRLQPHAGALVAQPAVRRVRVPRQLGAAHRGASALMRHLLQARSRCRRRAPR